MRDDKVYCDTCDLAYNMYMYSHNPDGDSTIPLMCIRGR